MFHQRYSTNTAPSWERAQPFRVLCHNGEINTLGANVRRMATREGRLGVESSEIEELFRPSVDPEGSDSSMLDKVIELLIREGAERDDSPRRRDDGARPPGNGGPRWTRTSAASTGGTRR